MTTFYFNISETVRGHPLDVPKLPIRFTIDLIPGGVPRIDPMQYIKWNRVHEDQRQEVRIQNIGRNRDYRIDSIIRRMW